MDNSKIIEVLKKYYKILGKEYEKGITDEELSFIRYIEFDMAKAIIEELSRDTAIRIADMIKTFYAKNPL